MNFLNRLVLVSAILLSMTAVKAIEGKVEMEGALLPIYIDGDATKHHHAGSLEYRFASKGKLYKAKFKNNEPRNPKNLRKIKIRGQMHDGSIEIDSFINKSPKTLLVNSTAAAARGEKRVLVVPLKNTYTTTAFIYDTASLANLYFSAGSNSIKKYYAEVSAGQVSLSGEVVNQLQLDNVCGSSYRSLEGDSLLTALQAIAARYDLSNFDILSIVVPSGGSCMQYGVEGLGSLGKVNFAELGISGIPEIAFNVVKSTQIPTGNLNTFIAITSHEFGHNFGLKHDNGNVCGKSIFYNQCASLAYGGAHSIMGNAPNLAPINAIHQEDLGWMNSQTIINLSGNVDQSYTITALESRTIAPKAIKINRGDGVNYFIEYHKPLNMAASKAFTHSASYEGFKVYVNDDRANNDSLLLRADMRDIKSQMQYYIPESKEYLDPYDAPDFAKTSDFTGEFYDSVNHVKVIFESRSADSLTLRVILGENALKKAEADAIAAFLFIYPSVENAKLETYNGYHGRIASTRYSQQELSNLIDKIEFDMDGDNIIDIVTSSVYSSENYTYLEPGTFTRKAKVYLKNGEIIKLESKEFTVVEAFSVSLRQGKASISSEPVLNENKPTKLKLQFQFSDEYLARFKKKAKLVNYGPFKLKRSKTMLKSTVVFKLALPPEKKISSYYLKSDGYYEFTVDLAVSQGYGFLEYKTVTLRVKSSRN